MKRYRRTRMLILLLELHRIFHEYLLTGCNGSIGYSVGTSGSIDSPLNIEL